MLPVAQNINLPWWGPCGTCYQWLKIQSYLGGVLVVHAILEAHKLMQQRGTAGVDVLVQNLGTVPAQPASRSLVKHAHLHFHHTHTHTHTHTHSLTCLEPSVTRDTASHSQTSTRVCARVRIFARVCVCPCVRVCTHALDAERSAAAPFLPTARTLSLPSLIPPTFVNPPVILHCTLQAHAGHKYGCIADALSHAVHPQTHSPKRHSSADRLTL